MIIYVHQRRPSDGGSPFLVVALMVSVSRANLFSQ
jgi:hypothetical protein